MEYILELDVSDVQRMANQLRQFMSEAAFKTMLRRTVSNTGRKVKSIIRKEVPKIYQADGGWVASAVGAPRNGGGGGISCVIPIKGSRGTLGSRFPAQGGGKAGVQAMLLRGSWSSLPSHLPHQGGNPPFFAMGIVMTRKTNRSHPIVRVSGLAVPQMPMNRSRASVENEIINYMGKELERQFNLLV